MARRIRNPKTEDLDLTTPEERRTQKIRRRLLIGGLFLLILLVAGWYEGARVRHTIKAWQSRRLAREATALMEKGEWKSATDKARDAYELDPTGPEPWRTIGRLMSRTRQDTAALEWWRKLEEAGRLTLDDRREYAGSALFAGELTAAAAQIEPLLAQPGGPTPRDMLLAANLASRRGDGAIAIDYAERALGDSRSGPNELFSGATLLLGVTRPDSPPYARGWKQIEDLARDPANPVSLDALTVLTQQGAPQPARAGEASGSLSLAQNEAVPPVTTLSGKEIADRLGQHPKARSYHQLLAMKLRAREEPSRVGELLGEAIERFRNADDETLIELGAWVYTAGRYEKLLEVMPLERALHRRELYLQYLDALAALGRFQEVRDLLASDRFRLDPVSQHMYLAMARGRVGEETGMANEWERALEAADDPAKCMALAGYAERAGAREIADRACAQAISFAPRTRAAYDARVRLARARGETTKAREIVTEILRLWPGDNQASNDANYLDLLLGASGEAAEKAVREGEIVAAREPTNWQARATVALGNLRLGRPAAALQAFNGVRAEEGSPVGPLAIRAVALDANGWKDGARGDARTLSAAPLLPEERALLAPLLAGADQ